MRDHWETQCALSTHTNQIGRRSAMSEAYTELPEEGDQVIDRHCEGIAVVR